MKHTKGEWRACCLDAKPHFVFAGEDKTICSMSCNDKNDSKYDHLEGVVTIEECKANAKLIAAAPELLLYATNSLLSERTGGFSHEGELISGEEAKLILQLQRAEAIKKATE